MKGSYSITIDGQPYDVNVRELGRESGERVFDVEVGDTMHKVRVNTGGKGLESKETDPGKFRVSTTLKAVNGVKRSPVKPVKPVKADESAPSADQKISGVPVKAPMTGRIVRILVNDGQKVAEGDALFVLEAMKMENSIYANTDGLVRKIAFKAGDNVRNGDILCLLQH